MIDKQIKSKKRVKELAEVYTNEREVNSMLDLIPIKSAEEQLSYTYLEPACGNGNFLIKILERKLNSIKNQKNYNDTLKQYELLVLKAVSTIYAIDICPENVFESKERIFNGIKSYFDLTRNKEDMSEYFIKSINYILNKNIVVGNFIDENNQINFNDIGKEEMKFNVIIGNPPYQKNDGGGNGNNSKPIYNLFIDKSKELKPNYMSFIIPSRWMSGGRGLDNFRKSMLNDKRFKKIIDFKNSLDCFSNVDIKGGICYFLWELKYDNKCEYTIKKKEKGKEIIVSSQYRDLNKYDVFIRDNKAINILEKVLNKIELFNKKRNIVYMNKKVSSQSLYADMNERLFQKELKYNENIYLKEDGYKVYVNKDTFPKSNNGIGYIEKDLITKPNIGKYINNHKVFIPKTFRELKNKPFYGEPNSICAETYIVIDICKNKKEAKNLINYFNTDLVSFLIKQKKITHNSSKETYSFIPSLNMKYNWTNEKLYKLFNISNSEMEYMSKSIKDMVKLI